MNTRKLSLILLISGPVVILASVLWFLVAYAETIDAFSQFGGDDMAAEMIACLYSSPDICEAAGIFDDAPLYSPAVFWLGLVSLIVGVVLRLSPAGSNSAEAPLSTDSSTREHTSSEHKLAVPEFMYAPSFTKHVYLLMLAGAVLTLFFPLLAILGAAGFVLSLLRLFVVTPPLTAPHTSHLSLICIVFPVASTLLLMTIGNFLFLLTTLLQMALYYVGFNSYRHGRSIGFGNLKDEAMLALMPGATQRSNHEQEK